MNPVASRLTKDHEEIDALLRRLTQDAGAPLAGALETTWEEFETKLLRHMDTEEQFLLPLIDASDQAEVARIRCEHAIIRNRLTELGVAIELHSIREPSITELGALLQAHAKHENAALYRLAGDKASSAVEHSIAELLKHGVAVAHSAIATAIATATRAADERGQP